MNVNQLLLILVIIILPSFLFISSYLYLSSLHKQKTIDNPVYCVSMLSESMQYFPEEDFLTGYDLMFQYDHQVWRLCAHHMLFVSML